MPNPRKAMENNMFNEFYTRELTVEEFCALERPKIAEEINDLLTTCSGIISDDTISMEEELHYLLIVKSNLEEKISKLHSLLDYSHQ